MALTGNSGWVRLQTVANDSSDGTLAWVFGSALYAEDGDGWRSGGTGTSRTEYSQRLRCTNPNTNSIPNSAEIVGIEMRVHRIAAATTADGGAVYDEEVRLYSGGLAGTDQSSATIWAGGIGGGAGAWETKSYGSSSSLWGFTSQLLGRDVQSSSFGVSLQAKVTSGSSTAQAAYVDWVEMRFHWNQNAMLAVF